MNNPVNSQPNKQAPSFPGKDTTEKKAGYQPNSDKPADSKTPAEGEKGKDAQTNANKPSDTSNASGNKSNAA